jgi:putative ABC transport system permease protein
MWLKSFLRRIRGLWRSETIHQEITDELKSHIDMRVEESIRRGMSPDEARRDAERSFGNFTRIKEQGYDVRGGQWLEAVWQDLRYSARMLRKQPGFTVIAVLTLALGIGANTAIFSIVNAVLLRPFPYQAPERLMILRESVSGGVNSTVSYPNFADWRAQNTVFASIAAVRQNESFNLTGTGEPERLQGQLVSAEFFSTLGIKPLVGRDFLPEEDLEGATPAVILS